MSDCITFLQADLCTIAVDFFTFSSICPIHTKHRTARKQLQSKARFRKTIRHILSPFGNNTLMKQNRWFIKATAGLSACIFALGISACDEQQTPAPQTRSTPISVAEAAYLDLSHSFVATAQLEPYQPIQIASRIEGIIEQVLIEEGDRVAKGDTLARMDTRLLQAELRRNRILLAESKAFYQRTKQLYNSGAISEAEYLAVRRDYDLAEHDVAFLELQISYGHITSPSDAVVSARYTNPGNSADINQLLFEIFDPRTLVLRPGLSELDVRSLQAGQRVPVQFDVWAEHAFEGRIRRIYPAANPDSRLFTVEVELLVQASSPIVRPGYLGRLSFVTDLQDRTLVIPVEALAERNNDTVVFVLDDEQQQVRMQQVQTGIRRDGQAQILSGLQEGDVVAAANLDALDQGTAVQVTGTFRRSGFSW